MQPVTGVAEAKEGGFAATPLVKRQAPSQVRSHPAGRHFPLKPALKFLAFGKSKSASGMAVRWFRRDFMQTSGGQFFDQAGYQYVG